MNNYQFGVSGMIDIGIPIARVSEHNAISARTPPNSDGSNTSAGSHSTNTTSVQGHTQQMSNDIEFFNHNTAGDLDMSDFLNFDSNTDWAYHPLEQGAHGESGGFVGDMGWIDAGAESWSRLNSPAGSPEPQHWGGDGTAGRNLFGSSESPLGTRVKLEDEA